MISYRREQPSGRVTLLFRGHPVPKIERLGNSINIPYRVTLPDNFLDRHDGHYVRFDSLIRIPRHEAEDIEVTKRVLTGEFCQECGVVPAHPKAVLFREFLDYLHETCGVLDTTVLERQERGDRPRLEVEYEEPQTRILGIDTGSELQSRCFVDWGRAKGPVLPAFKKKRNTPERKAMALLYKRLDRKQRQQLKGEGSFYHTGKAGHFKFMLHGMSGVRLITTMDLGGRLIETTYELCIQSLDPNMPKGDVILARYLECKHDEDAFLATCNFRSADIQDEAISPRGRHIADVWGANWMASYSARANYEALRAERLTEEEWGDE